MTYLAVIFLVGGLIFIHELGHLLAARAVGIRVARFSIGIGPVLWSFRRGGVEYAFSAIPFGGYVLPEVADADAFMNIPVRRRLAFLIGGPLANVLFAVPAFALLNSLSSGFTWFGALVAPWGQTVDVLGRIVASLPRVFAEPGNLSGVVGIVAEGGAMADAGLAGFVTFAIILSLNLAVLNLLPLPVLDGGKIVLSLLEKLHPAARRLHLPLNVAGAVLLVGLMVYTTVADIMRYFV